MSKKGNVQTVVSTVAISKEQLKDDVISIALANGFTEADVERMQRQDEYRRLYNQRPDVVLKRKQYSAMRYQRMKQLRELLK